MNTGTTTGDPLPRRGEVWWVRVDKRRPAVVVQTDRVREPRVQSFLVVPLTSRLHLEGLPGTVRLDRRATGLPRTSVANVYDVQKILRSDFVESTGTLPAERLAALDAGLRLVLDL
ncbi:MAG: type II toxin-antitoxin system PemK/MazF family toxin [Acidobacteriota bacterium]